MYRSVRTEDRRNDLPQLLSYLGDLAVSALYRSERRKDRRNDLPQLLSYLGDLAVSIATQVRGE